MRTSSLGNKTVRPGMYSFYHSDRRPQSVVYRQPASAKPKKKYGKIILTAVILIVAFSVYKLQSNSSGSPAIAKVGGVVKSAPAAVLADSSRRSSSAVVANENNCAENNLDKLVLISISKRQAWVCEKNKQIKNSAVITGMESIESTKTPTGTFHIYGKVKDTVLSGNDPTTGPWREPVGYWMPYHDNQYGTYGFHDAPWRKPSEFGNIDPNSMNGSHGCVQLPTDMAKWLYDWAEVGTTVVIKS